MVQPTKTLAHIWRSAELYIGFHRDPDGQRRTEAKVWAPKNARATIHSDPGEQEAFVVVKSAQTDVARDVQVKLRPDKIVLRRDLDVAWKGIVVEDHRVSVQVGGIWVRIMADGSVFKKTEFVDAMMSGDGVELSRRTPTTIAAITEDGVVAKSREKPLLPAAD